MHEKGEILINKAMKKGKISGIDKNCEYYPCQEGLEDCTFCFCPFYPCYQENTGGYEKISTKTGKPVWACSSCILPHKIKNAKIILKGLIDLGSNFNTINRDELMDLLASLIKKSD